MKRTLLLDRPLRLGCMVLLLTTGCLSKALWDDRTEYGPAPDPRVELRLKGGSPADVLVIYDQSQRGSDKRSRRAFYLFANEARLAVGKRPAFVDSRMASSHVAIPILKAPLPESETRTNDLYAVSGGASVFQLCSRGHTVAAFRLPEYDNWLTTKKFFLFPLAAAADAAAVGAVAGAAAGVGSLDGVSFRFP